jgi:hypothetical protein
MDADVRGVRSSVSVKIVKRRRERAVQFTRIHGQLLPDPSIRPAKKKKNEELNRVPLVLHFSISLDGHGGTPPRCSPVLAPPLELLAGSQTVSSAERLAAAGSLLVTAMPL